MVYTEPNITKVTRILDEATTLLESGQTTPRIDFTAYGFKEVDPLGSVFRSPSASNKNRIKMTIKMYRSHDMQFKHFLQLDPDLEMWRALAANWVQKTTYVIPI